MVSLTCCPFKSESKSLGIHPTSCWHLNNHVNASYLFSWSQWKCLHSLNNEIWVRSYACLELAVAYNHMFQSIQIHAFMSLFATDDFCSWMHHTTCWFNFSMAGSIDNWSCCYVMILCVIILRDWTIRYSSTCLMSARETRPSRH